MSAVPDESFALLRERWHYFSSQAITEAQATSQTLLSLYEDRDGSLAELAGAGGETFDGTWPYVTPFSDLSLAQRQRVMSLALSGSSQAPGEFATEFGGLGTPAADAAHQQFPEEPGAPTDASGWSRGAATVAAANQLYLRSENAAPEEVDDTFLDAAATDADFFADVSSAES